MVEHLPTHTVALANKLPALRRNLDLLSCRPLPRPLATLLGRRDAQIWRLGRRGCDNDLLACRLSGCRCVFVRLEFLQREGVWSGTWRGRLCRI